MTAKVRNFSTIGIPCNFIRSKVQRIAQVIHRGIVFFVCIRERRSEVCKDVVFTTLCIFSIIGNIHRERAIVHRRSNKRLVLFRQNVVFIFPERIERVHIMDTTETSITLNFLA